MKAKDILWGQNWIEQFRPNVGVYPCSNVYIGSMSDLYGPLYRTVSDMIYDAFVWRHTPQHPHGDIAGVWRNRWEGVYVESPSRARLHR